MNVTVIHRPTGGDVSSDSLIAAALDLFRGPGQTTGELFEDLRSKLADHGHVYLGLHQPDTSWRVTVLAPTDLEPRFIWEVAAETSPPTDQQLCDIATHVHLQPLLRSIPADAFEGAPEDYEITPREGIRVTPTVVGELITEIEEYLRDL